MPTNSTVSCPNTNFSGFRIMPLCPQVSSQSTAWKKLPSMFSAQRSVSSIHFVLSGMPETISSKHREKPSPDAKSAPWGYKGGKIAVVRVYSNTMVAIPTVEDGFFLV